jgi:hypothetical protein
MTQAAVIGLQGKFLTKPEFGASRSPEFKRGLAAVKRDELYGYINPMGVWVIPPQFDIALDFVGDLGLVARRGNSEWGYVDRQGKLVWKGFWTPISF